MIGRLLHRFRVRRSRAREAWKSGRDPSWDAVRDAYLAEHKRCEACGWTLDLQVHHVMEPGEDPVLWVVGENMVALCMGPEECHLRIGHGGSFNCRNPMAAEHAAILRGAGDGPGRAAVVEAVRARARKARAS
jgi:hypothetical protein